MRFAPADLTGREALISGSTRGLGEATARRPIGEGAQVVLGDVLVESRELLAAELGAPASFVALDVTSDTGWARAVADRARTFQRHQPLEIHAAEPISHHGFCNT
jgi:3alpha(or 20beta)-hydroxysteroid dehydrogenase